MGPRSAAPLAAMLRARPTPSSVQGVAELCQAWRPLWAAGAGTYLTISSGLPWRPVECGWCSNTDVLSWQANAGLEALLLGHNALGAKGTAALCTALSGSPDINGGKGALAADGVAGSKGHSGGSRISSSIAA